MIESDNKSLKIRDVPGSQGDGFMAVWMGWLDPGIPVSWLDDGLLQGLKKARVSWCLLL